MSVKNLSTVQMLMNVFERTSSASMDLGFTAMMSKQKPILPSGSQKRHPDPKKKHGKVGPM